MFKLGEDNLIGMYDVDKTSENPLVITYSLDIDTIKLPNIKFTKDGIEIGSLIRKVV